MSRRDSDSISKRRHSTFDPQPSPKRYARDGKHDRDRYRDRDRDGGRNRDRDRDRDRLHCGANPENGCRISRGQRNHRHPHDALPLEAPLAHHSKQESGAGAVHKDTDKKPTYHNEAPKHAPDPTQVPRSLSDFQHDEQGSAGQVGQSSGQRKSGERGWWKDAKNQHNERSVTSRSREQRDEKSEAKPDNPASQRRDGFSETKDDPPPTMRKRPAFREKKITVDSGDPNPIATLTVNSSQHPPEKNERRGKRRSNPQHLDRLENQSSDHRAPNKGEAGRDRFPPRGRYGGNSNYRGRDEFNGRQGYHPIKTRTEKWKHDLYQEVNKDPIPQNEDDQIAKLEALLAT